MGQTDLENRKWRSSSKNCTASHLRGKRGRANQTAQLTMWWRKIQGGGFRRGVIHAETQAHLCKLQAWAAWLTGCTEANTWKWDAWGSCDSKGREKRQNDLGRDHESFMKVGCFFSLRKRMFVESMGKNPKLFSFVSHPEFRQKSFKAVKTLLYLTVLTHSSKTFSTDKRGLRSHADLPLQVSVWKKVLIISWTMAFSNMNLLLPESLSLTGRNPNETLNHTTLLSEASKVIPWIKPSLFSGLTI